MANDVGEDNLSCAAFCERLDQIGGFKQRGRGLDHAAI